MMILLALLFMCYATHICWCFGPAWPRISVNPNQRIDCAKRGVQMGENDFLVVEGMSKSFNGFVANDHINLRVGRGHVHALLGENGAGKSTLMKLLYGVYRPDSGTIQIDGKLVQIHSPADARQTGIGMVFQSFMLIPAFSVIENVALSLKDLGIILDNQ